MGFLAGFYKPYDEKDTARHDLPLEPFARIHPFIIDEARRMLEILEAVEWRWTITEIQQQPAALLDAIIDLKSTGIKMREQMKDQQEGKNF